ncbi:CRISPR-associated endonuclease Cas3'' [Candidatus Competibacter phosphatis]|uniref:CRISPR-associated endonuclease Cas3'' n=1 Tax=Candidatus Competibacter phosphatis TaxID=221280 RepID=UPI0028AE57A1|nr:CRISPR-associated endonuclease Cas3'' [Candidatus Competibacter phosphatis]
MFDRLIHNFQGNHMSHVGNSLDFIQDCSSIFLAHVQQDADGQWLPHLLDDHLRGVAALAESFATGFDAGDWAKLAGLWHDLGKYRPAFQRYIRSVSGYDAHIETTLGRVDHSTVGALHAIEKNERCGPHSRLSHRRASRRFAGLAKRRSAGSKPRASFETNRSAR